MSACCPARRCSASSRSAWRRRPSGPTSSRCPSTRPSSSAATRLATSSSSAPATDAGWVPSLGAGAPSHSRDSISDAFVLKADGGGYSMRQAGAGGGVLGPSSDPGAQMGKLGVFVSAEGDWVRKDVTRVEQGFSSDAGGVTVGADYRVLPSVTAGLAFTYLNTHGDFNGNN